jgi:hypothetical protein
LSIVWTKFAGSIDGEYVPWTGASVDADRGEEVGDDEPPPLDELHAPARRAKKASGAVNLDTKRRTASPRLG